MNDRQHQRNQADGRLAALALRALVGGAILGFTCPSGWGPWRRFPVVGRAGPGFPIRRSVATINSASLDYAACSGLLRRVKGRAPRKLPEHPRFDPAALVQSSPDSACRLSPCMRRPKLLWAVRSVTHQRPEPRRSRTSVASAPKLIPGVSRPRSLKGRKTGRSFPRGVDCALGSTR